MFDDTIISESVGFCDLKNIPFIYYIPLYIYIGLYKYTLFVYYNGIPHRCPSFGYSMALFSARSSRHSPGATSGLTTSASLRHGKNAGMWKNT